MMKQGLSGWPSDGSEKERWERFPHEIVKPLYKDENRQVGKDVAKEAYVHSLFIQVCSIGFLN